MWTQRLMWIAWPAFLMAGVLEMLVFAMVDPPRPALVLATSGVVATGCVHPRIFCVLGYHAGHQRVDDAAVHVAV